MLKDADLVICIMPLLLQTVVMLIIDPGVVLICIQAMFLMRQGRSIGFSITDYVAHLATAIIEHRLAVYPSDSIELFPLRYLLISLLSV